MNIFKKIKLFKEYKTSIKENKDIFFNEFALEYNNWYELYTTISFKDAPEEIVNTAGLDALVEVEIKKFIKKFSSRLEYLNLYEFINLYEIKQIDEYNYGITFGYSLHNNKSLILIKILMYYVLPIIAGGVLGLTII